MLLFLRVNGYYRGINLPTIYYWAWRIRAAQCECRHQITGSILFDMVEVNLAIGYKINESIAVYIGEVFRGLGLGT